MKLGIALSTVVAIASASDDWDRYGKPLSSARTPVRPGFKSSDDKNHVAGPRSSSISVSKGTAKNDDILNKESPKSNPDATIGANHKPRFVLRNESDELAGEPSESIDAEKGDTDSMPDLGVIDKAVAVADGIPADDSNHKHRLEDPPAQGNHEPCDDEAGAGRPSIIPEEQRVLKPRTDCEAACPNGRPVINVSGWDFAELIHSCAYSSSDCPYDLPINCWDTSRVTNMDRAFKPNELGSFNEPLNCWNVSSVTSMYLMFNFQRSFNQPIGDWDVSSVIDMGSMFKKAYDFNQPIGDWDVSSMEFMDGAFDQASSFNQPLRKWDVSKVKGMSGMFSDAISFNQPLDKWDVSRVGLMAGMFDTATSFNQPIDIWDVSRVYRMDRMFANAANFDQCLSTWASKTPTDVYTEDMLKESGCPQQSDPDPSVGPWCQMETESCSVDLGPCTNKGTFRFKRETYTCTDLENFSNKMRNKACNKRPAKKACPGVCNVRCVCEDKKFFRIKPNSDNDFRGKFRCKNVNKDQQPSCDTKVKKGKLVKEVCPKQCGFCL